ncbi:MAG: CRTAC1 family protein [Planctomycetota bacterium]|jgi:hypothetical protein|nr:CRTAC1 family protein [Planctomycetota bacterium]MDP6763999.1 CRTAC1 family protein [Planctomycetota bacterium]MDP6988273.1 CRTAC1 family protein [Planctomycetota bacterium]
MPAGATGQRTLFLAIACVAVCGASVWVALRRGDGAAGGGAEASQPGPAPAATAGSFTDVTLEAGIDFVHDNGARGDYLLCEIMGPGGALFDYDGDGLLDVFFVQSGVLGDDTLGVTSRLYRNEGGGAFTDVSEASGAAVGGYGMGCAVGDHDGDGTPDLYVTRVGPDVLLANQGDGSFRDVTAEAGLANDGYTSSAVWFDADGDDDLDLYVARYTDLAPGAHVPCTNFLGHREYCDPSSADQTRDLFYRNLGGGRFEDVSTASGVALRTGYGLAVVATDLDDDGLVDVYVANDQSPAFYWRNRGDGTFEEVGPQTGSAYNGQGVAIAGMGIVAEDLDGDADVDLFITNIRQFSHLFLRNDGVMFTDASYRWGDPRWMLPHTGFGTVALDAENDGTLELFVANGAVARSRSATHVEAVYAEPNQFLRRDASGRFVEAGGAFGSALLAPAVSRGLACGDIDNDGDVDLLVFRNADRPQLLRNDTAAAGHWLSVLPVDEAGRGPVLNARVRVEAGGARQVRECRAQLSYLASCDPRVHFGLGEHERVDAIGVRWPDGSREVFGGGGVDRFVTLRRGSGEAVR